MPNNIYSVVMARSKLLYMKCYFRKPKSVMQVKIAQQGPILYVSFSTHTLAVSFYLINFINYDLCLGTSTFTPFAVGCSVLKRTDLI